MQQGQIELPYPNNLLNESICHLWSGSFLIVDTHLDRCIVIATWEYRISDEEHICEWDSEVLLHLVYAILLVYSLASDVNRRCSPYSGLVLWYTDREKWEHRESLLLIWIPCDLDSGWTLLSES